MPPDGEYHFIGNEENKLCSIPSIPCTQRRYDTSLIEFHCDDVCLAGSLSRPCNKLYACRTLVTDCLASSVCCSKSLWLAIVFLQLRSWLVNSFCKDMNKINVWLYRTRSGAVPLPFGKHIS